MSIDKLEKQNAELNARLRKELEIWQESRGLDYVLPFPKTKKIYEVKFPNIMRHSNFS